MAKKRVKAHKRKNGTKVRAYKRTTKKRMVDSLKRTQTRKTVLHAHRVTLDGFKRTELHQGCDPSRRF